MTSSNPNKGLTSLPNAGFSRLKLWIPAESFSNPNSAKEQIIPSEGTPRNFVFFSVKLILGR